MIDQLFAAAAAARKASTDPARPYRDVEIVVTEEGFAVRGKDVVNDHKAASSASIGWPEFETRPFLLPNCVALVVGTLDRIK